MNSMTTFIARMIMEQADRSTENGQDKYRAYFVNTKLYTKWQEDVNSILETDGCGDVIVAE